MNKQKPCVSGFCKWESPNCSLRLWLYRAARADLRGEKIRIPGEEGPYDASITY